MRLLQINIDLSSIIRSITKILNSDNQRFAVAIHIFQVLSTSCMPQFILSVISNGLKKINRMILFNRMKL